MEHFFSKYYTQESIHLKHTCIGDPHGNCIMTSAVVCSNVWNTSNNGSTAWPATVTSCNGCSHTGASLNIQNEMLTSIK